MSKKAQVKFEFDSKFQEDILKYIVTDDYGVKALNLIKPEYFDLIEHTVIATVLRSYQKKNKKVIKNPNVLVERIKVLFKDQRYRKLALPEDIKSTLGLVDSLYKSKVKDGNDILNSCMDFARYVEVKTLLEEVDILDFPSYESFATKIKKAITVGNELKESKGLFVFEDAAKRLWDRKFKENSFEFPFKQLNRLTNGNGYGKGSIIVVMDREKALKTTTLVNVARKYAKMKKRVIVFDLDNGEQQYGERFDQSLLNIDKKELLSGDHDNRLMKLYRQFKRLKIEIVIKKLPAYTTNADTLRYWLDYYYNEHGIRFEYMIIDYIGKMGSLSGSKEDNQRISDAYVEVDNVANEYNIIHTWTGHHVIRTAYDRRKTKYKEGDTAKCIDINRHVHMMLGIQQNEVEAEKGVIRLEVIVQRDGPPSGKVWLSANPAHQRIEELNKHEIEEMEALYNGGDDDDQPKDVKRPKKTTGDI